MDIIAAIDHATGCHTCGRPLDTSPSDLFCRELCQTSWQADQADAPPDPALPPRSGDPHTDWMVALIARATARTTQAHDAAETRLAEVGAELDARRPL